MNEENPFRRRRWNGSFFYWLPYVVMALLFVLGVMLFLWAGDMRLQDCKANGGVKLRSVGRYAEPLCLDAEGRIVE